MQLTNSQIRCLVRITNGEANLCDDMRLFNSLYELHNQGFITSDYRKVTKAGQLWHRMNQDLVAIACSEIRWDRSKYGNTTSKCGRWEIVQMIVHCTTYCYVLRDSGTDVGRNSYDTQNQAKAAAARLASREQCPKCGSYKHSKCVPLTELGKFF